MPRDFGQSDNGPDDVVPEGAAVASTAAMMRLPEARQSRKHRVGARITAIARRGHSSDAIVRK
ncbi:hypothetical protein A4A58_03580 [Tardiphaga robiniae]|uniref:Uncharacterized protein n=1 Tax=Tardiphaga robiniae TaxID=943830 RepID=A0A164AYN4_9BRAD|nr:hypothetical protein A4A58_03580 [Tardiphaga robiniae]